MSERDTAETTDDAQGREPPAEGAGAVLTRTLFRLGLAIVGFVLLLFALEQAFDIELFDALEDALATETGRWLAVAFLALLLIAVALGGWRYRRPPA